MFAIGQDGKFPGATAIFGAREAFPETMQPYILGASLERPATPDAEPADAAGSTLSRRPSAGSQRAPRPGRKSERRDTLRSLAAELSAAAAVIDVEEDAPALRLARSSTVSLTFLSLGDDPVAPAAVEDEDEASFADLRMAAITADGVAAAAPALSEVALAGVRDELATAAAVEEPAAIAEPAAVAPAPVVEVEVARATVQIEMTRAELDVLAAKYDAEAAARAAAERRLAEAQDELRFLRDEIQMVNQKRPKQPSKLGGALRLLTGRRRRVVPANTSRRGA